MADLHAYVGRQAIFDRKLNVVGYELLYRNSEENRARFSDGNQATAATMLNALIEIGLDQLAPGLPVWVNLPVDFLLGKLPIPLPPERTWIEVLEDVPVTPALLEALEDFRDDGYRIALDDFELTDATRPLLPLAHAIKLDVLNTPQEVVTARYRELEHLASQGVTLLAEKISTRAELDYLMELGFSWFQGHFLELPIISKSSRMPHDRTALVRILSQLFDPKLDMRQLERMLAAEVGLSVRVIKLASSAALSLGAPIASLQQAALRLGVQQIAALVTLIMVSGFGDKPIELARQALIRARMCELLAREAKLPPDQLFTAGLLSLLDAMLDRPLDEVVAQLPVSSVVREALVGDSSSRAAQIVEIARHQNRGDLKRVAGANLSAHAVFVAWFEAIRWADQIIATL